MRDLGTLSGDYASLALDINDGGTVVGASLDASFNPRPYVWKKGVMTDLNTLVRGRSALYLLLAEAINNKGEIVGFGATSKGELHGFLAIPRDRDRNCDAGDPSADSEPAAELPRPALSESARQIIQQELRHH